MLCDDDKFQIIVWLEDTSIKAIMEDGDLSEKATREEVQEFVYKCADSLRNLIPDL